MNDRQSRQGDVLINPILEVPKNSRILQEGNVILAYGEKTGHSHAVSNQATVLLESPDNKRYLTLSQEAELIHQEHAPLKLKPGSYEVVRQVEYTNAGLRNVTD